MTSDFEISGRKIIVTGHYGSGKTEFSVSLAMRLRQADTDGKRIAVVDLDIANPYFRSRERRELLNGAGIELYGSAFTTEVTAELPALGADVRAPLEDSECRVIVDAGGDASGALVLNQFKKYFVGTDTAVLAVINANRPETRDVTGAIEHIKAIECVTGLTVTGLVNNTHLLRETTAAEIKKGRKLCRDLSERIGTPLICNCYPQGLVDERELEESDSLMPVGLYMRPTWLDK